MERDADTDIVRFINYGEEIKEEDIKNLFHKFYRVEKNCDKNEGTGLGLAIAIVKTVMELHNGNVQVLRIKHNLMEIKYVRYEHKPIYTVNEAKNLDILIKMLQYIITDTNYSLNIIGKMINENREDVFKL